MKWIDGKFLGIRGKAFPKAENYRRLEENDLIIMDKVSPAYSDVRIKTGMAWLGTNSSGLHIDFKTDSKNICFKWSVALNNVPVSMTLLTQSGLDLYVKDGEWKYFSSAIPDYDGLIFDCNKKDFYCQCVFEHESKNFPDEFNEYSLNLCLYDEVTRLEVGIDDNAEIGGLDLYNGKPIVFYGSSLTQGCSASRPGMAYTNILRRKLNCEVCNLGFSGCGRLEHKMSEILSKSAPKLLIMDCVPNMAVHCGSEFCERFEYFYKTYRNKNKEIPILFMAFPVFTNTFGKMNIYLEYNEKLKFIFDRWAKEDKKIFWYEFPQSEFSLGEYSVDGIHGSDIGFEFIADNLYNQIKNI
ncbi:MAG: hypothetical protein KBT47_09715 [Armatimonadetes bacterium]|nr:hypothetical protein [Candidatus Hippobium faecium]